MTHAAAHTSRLCANPRWWCSSRNARPASAMSCFITAEWYMRLLPLAMHAKYSDVPMTQKRAACVLLGQ